ncbi:C3HC zinc finger-like-domain-containing protein [Chaetomium fimeti]|uniref:C3HC zinc finger-like-domain-containing protein n=1 Tax=Chaetomium fimeti TaxID=1854472 RepID=A0AAE0LRT3_9PEZI|nr:C3HC zinc finger-like-domain-containing protein [Chaetomium fimeti]
MNSNVKRKFNALLQGIGNRPPAEYGTDRDSIADPASSPASQRSSPHLPRTMASDSSVDLQKKRRVGGPTTTPSKYTTLQTTPMRSSPASIRSVAPTTTSVSNVTLRKWTPGAGSPAPDAREGLPPAPKYCPGDRDQLLRRLGTFQELTDWTPKPDRVSEVEWAKRGWACQGKERVRCTLCGRELVVKVNRKEVDGKEVAVLIASEVAESVVDAYAELIVESHAEDCLWRKRGCDDSLLRLPLPNPKLALQGLRQRYDELCERSAFLPYESNLRLPPTLDLDTIITHLPANFFTSPPPPPNKANPTITTTAATDEPKPNRPALALALLGWQSLTHPQLGTAVPNSASCHTCLRRLGLWMFKPREIDPASGAVLVPAPMDHLDPLREHRFFCPWKNPEAQRNPGAAVRSGGGGKGEEGVLPAAWEVLVVGLRNEAFIRERARGGVVPGHGRSKSSVPAPGSGAAAAAGPGGTGGEAVPKTPERPMTVGGGPRGLGGGGDEDGEEEGEGDDEEARDRKDRDMMSRLRRVKSLFNTKAGGKLRKLGSSRPGTSHSSVGGGE